MRRALATLLFFTACQFQPAPTCLDGGVDGGWCPQTSSGGDGGLSLDQLGPAIAQASCQSCAFGGAAAYVLAACPANQQAAEASTFDAWRADIDAGLLAYDPAGVQACLNAVATCSPSAGDACAGALVGQVPVGGSCNDPYDCDAGYCTASAPTTCPGVCAAYAVAGQNCSDSICGPNLFCIGGTCAPAPAPTPNGGSCSAIGSNCATGLYCNPGPDAGNAGTCAPQVASGGPCGQNAAGVNEALTGSQCQSGDVCAGLASGTFEAILPGTCQPQADVGQPCVSLPDDGGWTQGVTGCLFGLACVDNRCVIPPKTGPCAGDFTTPCDVTVSYCDPGTNRCQQVLPLGAACQASILNQCGPAGYCGAGNRCSSNAVPLCN